MTAEQLAQVVWAFAGLVAVGGFWLYAVIAVLVTQRSMFERRDGIEPRPQRLDLVSR